MNKNKAFLDEELNKEIEEIISSIVRDVHYEKTYPAHSAYYQLDFKAFRKRLKKVFDKQNSKISKLLEEIVGEMDKEYYKWNAGDGYYSNVSEAIDNIKNATISKINKSEFKHLINK